MKAKKKLTARTQNRDVTKEELAGFISRMNKEVIPQAVNMMETRRLLAVQKREEQLKC